MENLLVMVLCLRNFRQVDYQSMSPLLADSVTALSLIGLITSILGLISAIFQAIGWVDPATVTAIITWIATQSHIISSVLAGAILLYHDYEIRTYLITKFLHYQTLLKAKLDKPKKKVM